MVYDITSKQSFEEINNFWLNEVETYADPTAVMAIIGNKMDAVSDRSVSTEAGALYAKKRDMRFYEASAKTSENVKEAFVDITTLLINKKMEEEKDLDLDETRDARSIRIQKKAKKKNSGKCPGC